MNKINHFLIEIVAMSLMLAYIEPLTITIIAMPIFWGAMFSDFDHQINSHRNMFFHSIALNILVWYFNPSLLTALMTLGVGIHLICDCKWWTYSNKKYIIKGGTYCIDMFKIKRLSARWSTIWMILNFAASVVLFIYQLILEGYIIL